MTCDVTDCSCALNPLFSLFQSTNRTMSSVNVHLDIFMGDEEQHKLAEAAYLSTCDLLANNAAIYGLPSDPQHLSQEQQVILREIDVIAFSSMLSPTSCSRIVIICSLSEIPCTTIRASRSALCWSPRL